MKILFTTGKKQEGITASPEQGQLTTVIFCYNAAGSFIPSCLIFVWKCLQEWLLDWASTGFQASCTDNGWIKGETFLQWLQFFVELVCPNATRKVLLVLNNHTSHIYIKALDFAVENNALFMSFASHMIHTVQPLDVAVYGPLKLCFQQEMCTLKEKIILVI